MKDVILFCYKNLTVVIYILYIIETFGEEKSFALSDFHYFPNDSLISILNTYVIIIIFYSLCPFLSSSYLSLLFFFFVIDASCVPPSPFMGMCFMRFIKYKLFFFNKVHIKYIKSELQYFV